ncbi:MAG: PPC domain-containing protein, partial [Gammaproteobacteria bacterium]
PEGVKLAADPMPSAVDSFPVVFEAASDAPITGKLLDLVARTESGAIGHWRNDVELVQGPNNTSYYGTRVVKLLVAVTEAAPFKLRIEPPKVPIVQGGSMELKVVAERDPGFDEPISVRLVWNPPGVTSQPDITIPKGEYSAFYTLNAKGGASLRAWKIAVHGSATVNGGSLWVSSPLAPLEVAEPFLTAKIETTACPPGHSTNIVVKLEQKIPFEGKATLRLVGLPEKAAVPEKEITCKDTQVVFPLKVDPTCSTGSHKNLFCTAAIKKAGEVIPHNLGAGGIVRIVPIKKPAAAKAEPKTVAKNEKQ